MSGQVSVQEARVEAVARGGGVDDIDRDGVDLAPQTVPDRDGSAAAPLDNDRIHQARKDIDGGVERGRAGKSQCLIGVGREKSTSARISRTVGVSRVHGTSWQSMNTWVPSRCAT